MSDKRPNRYGWKPDLPDHRDFKYGLVRPAFGAADLPQTVDLRPNCSPVEDQGQVGSCTANALVGALEYLEIKSGTPLVDLSRLFLYYNERLIENDVEQDNGAQIRDGIKSLAQTGICPESEWPYIEPRFAMKPADQCYADAADHKISAYFRLDNLNDMLHCLAFGFPFVFGFTVYDYFESDDMAHTGILHMPTDGEGCLGGHAICAVGYDQSTKMFLIRNSWGPSWGIGGHFWMPFDYITNPDLATDFWKIQK
jgi:C1A family cysteine protease